MSDVPNPIFAVDVFADGRWSTTDVQAPPHEGDDGFRWLHFDLATPHLSSWASANLPISAARNLLAARTRPRVDQEEDGLIVTLRGINLNEGNERADMVSLRIWFTKNLIVTIQRQRILPIQNLREQIEDNDPPSNTTALIARLAEAIVTQVEDVADDIEDRAVKLEDAVYRSETNVPASISELSRTVIKLRRHIGPLNDALKLLAEVDVVFIPEHLRTRLRQVSGRIRRAQEDLSEVRDRLTALNEHQMMTQSARVGRNSYLLSIAAAIFLPLSFITSIVGLHFANLEWQNHPDAFLYYCGAMLLIGVALYLIFRMSRWF